MIRQANKFDLEELTELVKEFCKEIPSKLAKDLQNFDENNVKKLLLSLVSGCGFVFIDEDKNGFIAAVATKNTWFPNIIELHELAWWVKPEKRNTSLGGKLFISFEKQAKEWLDVGRIHAVFATLTANSPQINYEKRGFHLLETHYLMEK